MQSQRKIAKRMRLSVIWRQKNSFYFPRLGERNFVAELRNNQKQMKRHVTRRVRVFRQIQICQKKINLSHVVCCSRD